MFVYFLKHISEPRFKIGKANDIYQRLAGIGGAASYNLAGSLCLPLSSTKDALRIEKILHRTFIRWQIPVGTDRYSGDTEQFQIECFNDVINFVSANEQLMGGRIASLPVEEWLERPPPVVNPIDLKTRRENKRIAREKEVMTNNHASLIAISKFLWEMSEVEAIIGRTEDLIVLDNTKFTPDMREEASETMGLALFEYFPWGGGSALSWSGNEAFTLIRFDRTIDDEKTPYGSDAVRLFLGISLLSANQIEKFESMYEDISRSIMKHLLSYG